MDSLGLYWAARVAARLLDNRVMMVAARCHRCGIESIGLDAGGDQPVSIDGGLEKGDIDELDESITFSVVITSFFAWLRPSSQATLGCSYKACTASSLNVAALRCACST